jgi:N-acetyl-anhydromuramyl-L-alanine amidase AmpD
MRQLPGAHAIGPNARIYNERSIGICLVGDGDRRTFTPDQIASLLTLVRTLQRQYGIDDDAVVLHRDVAPTASPGRLFPELQFRERLVDID